MFLAYLQLENVIGKLKTQKYGDKILEVIGKHENDEEQGNGNDSSDEEQEKSANRNAKRSRNKKVLVIDSSEDEK